MKIVVLVKITPDTAQLRADPRSGAPRLDDAPSRIGTFDEHALEEAVRLKESHGGRVVAVSLAAAIPPELVHRILAMGADEVRLIEDPGARDADALATARILSAALEKLGHADLVLCGEGSLDAYNRQVGPRVAEELGMPVLSHVTRLEVGDGLVVAHRVLEDRTDVVEAALPLLVAVGQEINQPRFPTVLQIMRASAKPVVRWSRADVGIDGGAAPHDLCGVRTIERFAPSEERKRISIEGESAIEMAEELAAKLFELGLVRAE